VIGRLLALGLAFLPASALAATGYTATTGASSSLVVKSQGASLYDVNIVSGAAAGYVLVIDATAVPADGAVTPALCLPVAANTGIDLNMRAEPVRFVNGVVIVFSTTGCFAKTASATAFISASAM
jgi:hypothetical protein